MLTINPSSLRPSLVDAAGATGVNAPGSTADPAGFASLLRQTQATPAPAPAPIPAASADTKSATNEATAPDDTAAPDRETEAPSESDTTRRTRALLRGKPRAADAPAPVRPTPKTTAPEATEAAKTDANDKPVDSKDTPQAKSAVEPAIDPNVMHWLAGLQRAASERSGDAGDAGGTAGTGTTETDTSATAPGAGAKGARAADLKADAELKDKAAAQDRTSLADAAGKTPFAGVLAEQRTAEAPARPLLSGIGNSKDAAAAGASALAPAPSAGTDAAPVAVPIAAPVTAPDFAQELGLRLSVLTRDGVQHAELHLNPAEMGPVSVQIVMDGTQARVDFGADMAATRQAIEAGLPELASALRDAGFTLAGGGVSQHASERGDGGDTGASGRERAPRVAAEGDVKRVAAAAHRIVSRGGVDLFA